MTRYRPSARFLMIAAFFGIASAYIRGQERDVSERSMSGAFRSAVERFEERKNTPQVGALFIEALRTAESVTSVEWLIETHYPSIESDSERSAAAIEIGTVFELAHRYEEARRFYEEALRIDGSNDEMAIRTARVLVEIGNVSEALTLLDTVLAAPDSRSLQRQAAVIRGKALFLAGETERALLHARSLVGMDEPYDPERPPIAEIAAYAFLLEIARQTGDFDLFSEGYDRMERSFPGSPIVEMYRSYHGEGTDPGYRVMQYLSPSSLFRPSLPMEASEVVSETDASTPTKTSTEVIGIQTGSFSDRENAEYMAIDIEDLGFDATITEVTIGGDTYYRVLVEVPEEGSVEAVQTYVVRLKEHGIEGFLVFGE